jgi:hypothetical protein
MKFSDGMKKSFNVCREYANKLAQRFGEFFILSVKEQKGEEAERARVNEEVWSWLKARFVRENR